ncbi:MAG: hypothetical protein KAJ14_05895, partial [Candidatus Omnitrophica bacterium]|nr:hypothetical protein [Candidatus Omnitrophota bacterium]
EHRKGDNYDSHTDINIDRMRAVQDTVQSHVLDEYWPRSFIEREEEETWEELESRIEDMVFTDDLKLDDVLGKISVNIEDTEYVEAQIEKLKEKIEGYREILEDSSIDELEKIEESIVLERTMDLLKEVFKKNENKEPKPDLSNIEELGDGIGEFLDEYMWLDGGKNIEDLPLWAQYLKKVKEARQLMKEGETGAKEKEEALKIRNRAEALAAETAAFIYDDDVYIDKIIKILWGAQTVRAPNPIKKNLKELDEEFLKDLMQKREWKEKEYREISPALKLIWIKSALEEIRDSLNEDNSRKPDECKKHIQITIDKIEGHLDKYHWGIDLKLIDDEDNKIQQWEEELERLEEEKAASNKWKDKEELTRFIEKQAEECRKTNGDGDDFWIQRRANIRVLSGLTNLKGVKIGNKSGFEFIKELLEDKMNEENEKDIRVRKVAEELYPLFIAKNPDSIDDLDKLAEEEISTVGVLSVKERKEQIIDKIAGLEREITTRLKLHSLGQRTDGEMNEELQQAINFIGKYLMAQGKAYIEPLGRVEVLRMKSFIIDKVAFNNKKLEGKKAKLEMDKEFKIETGYPKAWVKGARSGWTNNMRFYTHSFVLILDENMNDPIEFLESLLDQVPLIEGVVGEWEFIIKRKIVEFLLKRLGLYGILGDVHELEKEVELPAPDKKYIALDYSSNNNHHSVNIVLVTYTNGKYRRILEKQNIGEGKGLIIYERTGIIRISEDKEVYIQYATQIGNYYFKIIIGGEDKLCAHKSKYKISTQSISIEEAYGEVHSGKSIVSLGVEYWMNERLKTRDEELLDEQKTILEKIKGYFKYENPELPEKKVW